MTINDSTIMITILVVLSLNLLEIFDSSGISTSSSSRSSSDESVDSEDSSVKNLFEASESSWCEWWPSHSSSEWWWWWCEGTRVHGFNPRRSQFFIYWNLSFKRASLSCHLTAREKKIEVFVSNAELNTSKRALFTPLRIYAKLRCTAHFHRIERSNYGKRLEHWV